MENNAVIIDEKDNVAIATAAVNKGDAVVANGKHLLDAVEDVEPGHKIALAPIEVGANVYRYGEPIVEATRAIKPGEWVHVHNTRPIPGTLEE